MNAHQFFKQLCIHQGWPDPDELTFDVKLTSDDIEALIHSAMQAVKDDPGTPPTGADSPENWASYIQEMGPQKDNNGFDGSDHPFSNEN